MEGHSFHVEYSTAGQQEGWARDLEVRSQETELLPKQGSESCQVETRQPSFPSWARASVPRLAQQSYFFIFRGKNCYEMYFPILGLFPGLYF